MTYPAVKEAATALLKIKQAAEELNTSPSFVYQVINEGRLRCYRLGKGQGGIRISREQLAAYLRESEIGTASVPSAPGRHIR